MSSDRPGSSNWLRWVGLLLASVVLAVAADHWPALQGTRWHGLIWLPALTIGSLLLVGSVWRLLTTHGSSRSPARAPRTPPDPREHLRQMQRTGGYRAVRLRVPEHGACDRAVALQNQVFDLYHAPSLPLADCPNKRCKCGYAGLRERRRRNVLPAGLSKDRRKGSVLRWPGGRP